MLHDFRKSKSALLTKSQVAVVKRFLWHLADHPDLKTALEHEIAFHCQCKVTKRLALQLALAVISNARDGMFRAERLAAKLQPRLKHDTALKEIYLERHTE